MSEVKFPRYLSSPLQILFLESDDISFGVASYVIGKQIGYFMWLVMPIVVVYFYLRFKKHYPRGFLRHLLYFSGLVKLKKYPMYFEQEFME